MVQDFVHQQYESNQMELRVETFQKWIHQAMPRSVICEGLPHDDLGGVVLLDKGPDLAVENKVTLWLISGCVNFNGGFFLQDFKTKSRLCHEAEPFKVES